MAALALLAIAPLGCGQTMAQAPAIHRDLAYGPHLDQRIDVYLPANPQGAPVLFMVHGGGWVHGDRTNSRVVDNKVGRWVPQSYIFVSVNNRLLPDADPLQQADDVGRVLAFAQSQAPSWGGDPDRFILMGHSAGAHLVALLAAGPATALKQGAHPWLGTLPLDSAAFDVVTIMAARHFRL